MSPTPHGDDRRVRQLLRTLEQDRSQVSDRRTEILRDVLAHYDRCRNDIGADLVELHPTSTVAAPRGRLLLLIASVVVAFVIGGLALLAGDRDPTSPADTPPTSLPTESLTMAGGAITFSLPDGLRVVDQRDGLAVIGRSPAATGLSDSIVVVDYGDGDFGAEVDRLFANGTIERTLSGSNVDGRRFDRWAVTLTQVGISELDCPPSGGCLELVPGVPETALEPGRIVNVTELVTDGDRTVLVMTDADGPLWSELGTLLSATIVE